VKSVTPQKKALYKSSAKAIRQNVFLGKRDLGCLGVATVYDLCRVIVIFIVCTGFELLKVKIFFTTIETSFVYKNSSLIACGGVE
jgi:hypothetical protein